MRDQERLLMGPASRSQLEQVFQKVIEWRKRVSSIPSAPQPGSSMARDDSITNPYQISHAVVSALMSAVDHLEALRSMISGAGIVHTHAAFTVLRASIENASVAVWLLAPANRDERVLRRLRLQWADFVDRDQAQLVISPLTLSDLYEKKTRLQAIGKARGFNTERVSQIAARPVAYGSIVEKAGSESRALSKQLIHGSWMLCSGMAHAKSWATLSLLDRKEIENASEGVLNLRLAAPDSGIVVMAHVAAMTVQEAWWSYDLRSAAY